MDEKDFYSIITASESVIEQIRRKAYSIHASVNQTYGVKGEPYSVHLEAVAQFCLKYLSQVCENKEDIIPVIFGAFFHDSIEDARLSYNDVKKIAVAYMPEDKAVLAAEIAYALTNDKGRTREERAGEKYYQGIRSTAYAPFVKYCDRLANTTYSVKDTSELNKRMLGVYKKEYPHFIQSILVDSTDIRFSIPEDARKEMDSLLGE